MGDDVVADAVIVLNHAERDLLATNHAYYLLESKRPGSGDHTALMAANRAVESARRGVLNVCGDVL